MNKQFWYSDSTQFPDKSVQASFNIDMVIRSLTMEDGSLLLVLSDGHTTYNDTLDRYPKGHKKEGEIRLTPQGKVTVIYTSIDWVQSKITLTDPEDIERFRKVTEFILYPAPDLSESVVFRSE